MKSASGRQRLAPRAKEDKGTAPPLGIRSAVPVLIVYSDIPSARHAMARLTQLYQLSGRILQPMLWRFDQLSEPRWREMALRDACRARTVAFALRGERDLERAPEMWFQGVLERIRGSSLNVLALIGTDQFWTLSFEQAAARSPLYKIQAAPSSATSQPIRVPSAPVAPSTAGVR